MTAQIRSRLVDEALQNGMPLSETYEIMEQSKKVHKLMLRADEEELKMNF